MSSVDVAGMWWAAIPRNQWGHPEGRRPDQQADWHDRFGDRNQQIVFIGQEMDEATMKARLDGCLLAEDIACGDSESWTVLPNPFPKMRLAQGQE